MKGIGKLALVLSFAVAARADLDWSAWKYTDFGSAGGQILLQGEDSRFEYRWRSGWSDLGSVCTVEIRASESKLIRTPEVTVVYSANRRLRTAQVHTGNLNVADCASVDAVISGRGN